MPSPQYFNPGLRPLHHAMIVNLKKNNNKPIEPWSHQRLIKLTQQSETWRLLDVEKERSEAHPSVYHSGTCHGVPTVILVKQIFAFFRPKTIIQNLRLHKHANPCTCALTRCPSGWKAQAAGHRQTCHLLPFPDSLGLNQSSFYLTGFCLFTLLPIPHFCRHSHILKVLLSPTIMPLLSPPFDSSVSSFHILSPQYDASQPESPAPPILEHLSHFPFSLRDLCLSHSLFILRLFQPLLLLFLYKPSQCIPLWNQSLCLCSFKLQTPCSPEGQAGLCPSL